jgi:hypothetical protein
MKTHLIVSALILVGLFACSTRDLTLIQNGSSDFEIVIPHNADSLEGISSNELQKYLQKISGVSLAITDEVKISSDKRIFIGNTIKGELLNAGVDEIIIKVRDGDLFILGGDPRSTLYAVYSFLENYLGCRFYAPDVEIIPETDHVTIPMDTDYQYTPPVSTRTVHSRLYYENKEFADKRKVTHEAFPGYVPGYGVHTFDRFVPSSKYYQTHPEYYALIDGRRIPTQLCLTNVDMLDIVKDAVAKLLDQYPDSKVISVSTNDNTQYCQCESCMAINDREESAAGSVIDFVNKIAVEFPDRTISTLAYQYTRKAPKYIKPGKNVLITLCSIECDRSAPIEEKCQDFAADLLAWGILTENIRIWDYTTQFTNFLAPFPNIHTLQPNIRFFRNNNARWIFEQHSHHPSELFEFRSYLTAQLLWDPDLNQDSIVTDFLNGYYEGAAPFIQQYITTIHDEIQQEKDFFLFLYGDPAQGFKSFLRPELLKQYDRWYQEAEQAVEGNPIVIKRVQQARLSTDFAILEAARLNDPEAYTLFTTGENGKKSTPDEIRQRLVRFSNTCCDADITLMNEMRFSVDEYLDFYESTLSRALEENIAIRKKVKLLQKPKKYAGVDPQTLTDGAFGGANFNANWLGFEGNDLDAIIDLEDITEISQISGDFLQIVNHIVFFPTDVKYYYSEDGENYAYLGKVNNKRPLTKQSKINDIQSFRQNFSPVKARFVKIVAKNMDTAPLWHHGAGLPSWIFVDEISVQ